MKNGPWVVNRSLVTTPSLTNVSSHQNGSAGSSIRKTATISACGGEPGRDPALHVEAVAQPQAELDRDILADRDRDGRGPATPAGSGQPPATRVA